MYRKDAAFFEGLKLSTFNHVVVVYQLNSLETSSGPSWLHFGRTFEGDENHWTDSMAVPV